VRGPRLHLFEVGLPREDAAVAGDDEAAALKADCRGQAAALGLEIQRAVEVEHEEAAGQNRVDQKEPERNHLAGKEHVELRDDLTKRNAAGIQKSATARARATT